MNIIIDQLILPEILMASLAGFILLWDAFIAPKYKSTSYILTQLGLIFIIFNIYNNFENIKQNIYFFNNSVVLNSQINFFKLIICSFMLIIFVYTKNYITSKNYFYGEYFALSLLSGLGMMIVVSSSHFLNFYLGIELFSLPIYTLIALGSKEVNLEAAVKYFVIGALFSGILLYGLSLIYGASGNLNFQEINNFIQTQNITMLFNTGTILVFMAMFFKLNLVPMHMWAPDIYQGAPMPITMLIATLPKIATVVIFGRIINEIFPDLLQNYWQMLLISIAILSLIIGNIGAILQNNIKRLLAYSAIGHTGFILLGFIANSASGRVAANFYVVSYALMIMGILGVMAIFSKANVAIEDLKHFTGLARKYPLMGGVLLILLLSMAGIPPTIGFYPKLLIIKSLINANLLWVAVIALGLSIVSLFYYLKIIKTMFFVDFDHEPVVLTANWSTTVVLSLNGILAIGLGIYPLFIDSILKYF